MDADVAQILRLSPLQEDLLRKALRPGDERPEPGVVAVQYREANFDDLERAWRHVQGRLPLLRTSVHWEGLSAPVQVVRREAPLSIRRLDWTGMDRQERRESLRALAASERGTPLRLDAAPLMRLAFVRLDRGGYVVWTYHPLILDRLSAGLALEAVQRAWHAYRRGESPPTEAADDGFARLVEHLQRTGEEPAREFWREHLSGQIARVRFSSSEDSTRDGDDAEEVDAVSLRTAKLDLGAKVEEALRASTSSRSLHLDSLLVAAVAIVSARRRDGDEEAVVVGLSVSGRPETLPEAEHAIGPFENVVPLKLECPREERLGRWALAVDERRRELAASQYFPLSRIEEWVAAPLNETWFDIVADVCPDSPKQLRPTPPQASPNRRRRRSAKAILAPQFPRGRSIVVRLDEESGGLSLRLRYDGERLHWLDADRLLRELESTLAALVERYDRPLGEILEHAAKPSVVPLHPGPAADDEAGRQEPAIYCVHPAGGGVACYAALAQRIGRTRPAFGLAVPEDFAERASAGIEALAAEHVRRLTEFQPHGPYLLAGWSFGGLVAQEIAGQLTRRGHDVPLLVLIDPPTGRETEKPSHGRSLSRNLLDYVRQLGWPAPKRTPRGVSAWRLAERLLSHARRGMLAPPGMTVASLIEQCRLYAAHVAAARTYRPSEYAGPTLTILPESGGKRRPRTSRRIDLTNEDPTPKTMFSAVAEGRCQVEYVAGSHSTLLRPPYVDQVADRIVATLSHTAAR